MQGKIASINKNTIMYGIRNKVKIAKLYPKLVENKVMAQGEMTNWLYDLDKNYVIVMNQNNAKMIDLETQAVLFETNILNEDAATILNTTNLFYSGHIYSSNSLLKLRYDLPGKYNLYSKVLPQTELNS